MGGSTSSDTTSRNNETVELRQPTKNKNNRHKRLSNLFHRSTNSIAGSISSGTGRWVSEKKLSEIIDTVPEDLVELSSQKNLPGILKIFGDDISSGTNYKSVLATPRSSAEELVKEALERYAVADSETEVFVLCDVVGRFVGLEGEWKMEYLRVVGDNERPLVLQEMWKPKTGFSRRFEIRRKQEVEKMTMAEDNETAGINAQARRLQKSRSRAASGGNAPLREREESISLRRSISDVNINSKKRRERKSIKSMVANDGDPGQDLSQSQKDGISEMKNLSEGDRNVDRDDSADQMDLDFERLSQCLIQPPAEHPYFLLLQGYNKDQDFVIYVMTRKKHLFGRAEKSLRDKGPYVDTFLSAPDILPRHCSVWRLDSSGQKYIVRVRPYRGALVTHNGRVLQRETELHTGDLLGLGEHFLFMYKDPRMPQGRPAWLPKSWSSPSLSGAFSCQMCGRSLQEKQEAVQAYIESREPVLQYRSQEEDSVLKEIIEKTGNPGSDFKLAPAYLFSLCLEHSTKALDPGHFPKLVMKIASFIKEVVWEKIKEIGDKQPENQQDRGLPCALGIEEVATDLRPLMLWMSNSMELLNFVQRKILDLEKEWESEGSSQDTLLSSDIEACEESMALLDEVIMYTFQQCVYYLTKTLYAALPALLESNPFTDPASLSDVGELSNMPEGTRGTLAIYQATLDLTRECELHPDLVSQTFGYLFFFSNASLFNTLMEKGNGEPFYQWSKAVQIRTNLDLVLDWLQGIGLGDIAAEFFRKLSATVNLLCIPKTSLMKVSWSTLRNDYPALSSAQLNHLLRNYHLGVGRSHPAAWEPPEEEKEEITNTDIFESFTEHPPLILPCENFRLQLAQPINDDAFYGQLCQLRRFVWDLEQKSLPANQRASYRVENSQ
ncbi:ras-interacting protein 1 isoform X3 [Xenopus tropicalis]|uniref:Ras-interacting protein 1 isoform X3 n=1 Tax=Xenopus tropicalis TaxID=8364 RepID=A0A8J0QRK1_XENTR|nr:ras-interacting protein 1 isoform X3 [Xenopus tropicalis]|eukprot:XP_002940008.2 PREDICTED: ras-interacting protein 1 isoform X3 [Xenopus tropicalis]